MLNTIVNLRDVGEFVNCLSGKNIMFEKRLYRGGKIEDENITNIIESSNQTLVICGHQHWDRPLIELGNKTQVLNVDSRVVILKP